MKRKNLSHVTVHLGSSWVHFFRSGEVAQHRLVRNSASMTKKATSFQYLLSKIIHGQSQTESYAADIFIRE
jgi:hypothetical protein